jgi:hypothetical protein
MHSIDEDGTLAPKGVLNPSNNRNKHTLKRSQSVRFAPSAIENRMASLELKETMIDEYGRDTLEKEVSIKTTSNESSVKTFPISGLDVDHAYTEKDLTGYDEEITCNHEWPREDSMHSIDEDGTLAPKGVLNPSNKRNKNSLKRSQSVSFAPSVIENGMASLKRNVCMKLTPNDTMTDEGSDTLDREVSIKTTSTESSVHTFPPGSPISDYDVDHAEKVLTGRASNHEEITCNPELTREVSMLSIDEDDKRHVRERSIHQNNVN